MDSWFLLLVFYCFLAFLLTAVGYGMALLLRSKFTPIQIQGGTLSMLPMFAGGGMLLLSTCCFLPYSCAEAENIRDEAVEDYKAKLEVERPTGQWYYGALESERSLSSTDSLFEAPVQIQSSGDELRFTFRWKGYGTTERTTSFSGNLVKNKTHRVYQGTWYIANTNTEGEWALFEVDEGYFCGWVTDKGNRNMEPFYLRQER